MDWILNDHIYMVDLYFSDRISAVPTKEHLLREKKTWAKFQINISKTKVLFRVYTDMTKSAQLITLIIYIQDPDVSY